MICLNCGRVLKTAKSRELGYGPICYKRMFGSSKQIGSNIHSISADKFSDHNISGQMSLEDFLQPDTAY